MHDWEVICVEIYPPSKASHTPHTYRMCVSDIPEISVTPEQLAQHVLQVLNQGKRPIISFVNSKEITPDFRNHAVYPLLRELSEKFGTDHPSLDPDFLFAGCTDPGQIEPHGIEDYHTENYRELKQFGHDTLNFFTYSKKKGQSPPLRSPYLK